MVLLIMDMFVVMVFFPMDHLFDEPPLYQKRQRPIDGCSRDAASLFPKAKGEGVGFEMPFHRQGFPQNFLSLGSPFQSALFNIFYELRAGFPIHVGSPMTFNRN